MNLDYNLLNLYGWGFPTRAGQWARFPRPYDYGHASHECQHALATWIFTILYDMVSKIVMWLNGEIAYTHYQPNTKELKL